MASLVRPTMLRQLHAAAPAKRAFSSATCASRMTTPFANRAGPQAFVRSALPSATRVAAFHATSRQSILPAGPQKVKGTANEPVDVPESSPTHGSYHWSFERVVAASLLPLTVAPFASGSLHPVMDATLCGLIVIHSHFGFESCVVDYFPSHKVPALRSAMNWLLRVCTVLVAYGLYEFETNDVGVTEAVKRIWTAPSQKE